MALKQYKVLVKSFIGNKICLPGETVSLAANVKAGKGLEQIKSAKKADTKPTEEELEAEKKADAEAAAKEAKEAAKAASGS